MKKRKKLKRLSGVGSAATKGLARSEKVIVFSIPVDRLKAHHQNPNEQDETTFDQLVQKIAEDGQDEPINVYPETKNGALTGKYIIYSGHHRLKACKANGMTEVECIVREGWDEDKVAIELVARNQLRGSPNPEKFTKVYEDLKKRHDPEYLRKQMGFSKRGEMEKLVKNASQHMSAKGKKRLEDAKEEVNSVEDLGKIINEIFMEEGAKLDHGLIVFSFGGKKHLYIKSTKRLKTVMDKLIADAEEHSVTLEGALLSAIQGTPIEQAEKAKETDIGRKDNGKETKTSKKKVKNSTAKKGKTIRKRPSAKK